MKRRRGADQLFFRVKLHEERIRWLHEQSEAERRREEEMQRRLVEVERLIGDKLKSELELEFQARLARYQRQLDSSNADLDRCRATLAEERKRHRLELDAVELRADQLARELRIAQDAAIPRSSELEASRRNELESLRTLLTARGDQVGQLQQELQSERSESDRLRQRLREAESQLSQILDRQPRPRAPAEQSSEASQSESRRLFDQRSSIWPSGSVVVKP